MNKPQQKNRKKQLPHLVTIDDGLRLVSSSEDDDDEVESLPGVSLSLSHTHTEISSD
jgi:hypothetical protein